MKSFMCYNHQGKANAYIEALSPKWTLDMGEGCQRRAYFLLTDNDARSRVHQLEGIRKLGCRRFFVYPHTARPSLINDTWPAWEHTTAQFVVNEYHAEVLRKYGYTKPIYGTGWTLCPLREFQKKSRVRNVLFAPIHPRNAPIDREVNAEVFKRLHKLALEGAIHLTMRYIGNLDDNGLPESAEKVEYIQGRMNQDFREIDGADVLVGHQTVAWIAVARGIPTLMMAEDMPTHFRKKNEYVSTPSWNRVKRLFQFPLDILEFDDPLKALERAAFSDDDIMDWRERMIGKPFDPQSFVRAVESHL